ncbi:anhydro-N-acetylmuramic acid kinase [Amycolatopsis deserti]|uniref:Anhydro-N-acetylmuramic acid kinase n=1 Tax=Amycolatopsis deserti TaxID=185696 RepID=A0ABQ3JB23_9PSEU|nr:anhydro-N-acetylmuramic acid kinase [Amycolatopsis deserti]GHF14066.1 anhydro-N-acetylmuramic acid kinase [Amycolatopsis deserti]
MRVVGLISGTSVDGIDVALAELAASGDEVVLVPLGHASLPYPDDLRRELLATLPPSVTTVEQVTRLDTRVGQAFADAASTLAGTADLVASLGQTVFHWVEGGRARGTLQLGQPAWIAERTGLPVVADLRARDIAAGGHGAPLASTLDALWLRDLAPAVALNIGGIANVTVVRADGVQAFDTGPGNALLDLAAHQVTGGAQSSDLDGAIAARGQIHEELLDRLLAEPYYAAPPPKSTGKELFHAGYLRAATEGLDVRDEDLLATLTELTAVTIARACAGATTVIVSGGGADNPSLMRALARNLPGTRLATSDEFGLPREAKEAYLTALLGWLTWHGVPANLPDATGARGPRLLGSITPGAHPLSMPAPHPVTVTRLRVAAHPDQPIGVPDAPS